MAVLIAINSCKKYEDEGFSQHLRNTWLKNAKQFGFDYRFFVGRGADESEDVVKVNAGDSYYELGEKSVEKFRWALDKGYDFVFGADCDTAMCLEKLKTCGYEQFDYYGDFYHKHPEQPYHHASYGMFCQAGPGFFMSRKAMEYFVREYKEGLSDNLMGDICRAHSDVKIGDGSWERFATNLHPHSPGPRINNNVITVHLSMVRPDNDINYWHKKNMHEKLYAEWLAS